MFNISRPTAAQSDEVASPDLCPNTFNQIITSCIGDTAPLYWGGFWSSGVTNYSVTNNEFPTNPFKLVNLIEGAISDGIVGQTASSTASVGGADASGGGISIVVEGVSAASAASVNGSSHAGTASVTDSAGILGSSPQRPLTQRPPTQHPKART